MITGLPTIEAVQLRLFELAAERKQMKLTLLTLLAGIKKRCNKCPENGDMGVEQFYVDTRYRDNLYPVCRECKSKRVLARYHERKAA